MSSAADSIPYGKPAEVGNFRIWRSKYVIPLKAAGACRRGGRVRTADIECINISTADGSFLVRIPQTYEMFSMLMMAYKWSRSKDRRESEDGTAFLRCALSNMLYVSSVCNGFFHQGVQMVASAYADPSLLRDTENGRKFMEDARGTVSRFLEWHSEYEKNVATGEPDDRSDEIAEQAMDIVEGKEDF